MLDTTDEGENGTGARIAAAAVANDLATDAILLGVEGDSGVSDAREFGERAGELPSWTTDVVRLT